MKYVLFALVAFAAVIIPVSAQTLPTGFQTSSPSPAPDHHVYTDRAMQFVAPSNFTPLGQAHPNMRALGDKLSTIALWAHDPGKPDQSTITLMVEGYDQPLAEWSVNVQSELRNLIQGLFIAHRASSKLKNGMPAMWISMVSGTGFSSRQRYAYLWSDGVRGVVLAVDGRLGELSSQQAKAILENVRATMYPPSL